MFLVSSCSCLCAIYWNQVLSREWKRNWSSADRWRSNYIWVIDNFVVTKVRLILEIWRYLVFLSREAQKYQFIRRQPSVGTGGLLQWRISLYHTSSPYLLCLLITFTVAESFWNYVHNTTVKLHALCKISKRKSFYKRISMRKNILLNFI